MAPESGADPRTQEDALTGEEFLALPAEEQLRVVEEIAAGKRSPMIPGLDAAVREGAAAEESFAGAVAKSSALGRYREAQAEQLRRMTPEERMLRYREGKLTAYQGQVWEVEFPKEIPRVNGIPEWRARHSADVVG
jgi:hypothetical protein